MTSSIRPSFFYDPRRACKDAGFDAFFPDDSDREAVANAKRLCASCAVQCECLEYALAYPNEALDGIWAGTTRNERRQIRRHRRTDGRVA